MKLRLIVEKDPDTGRYSSVFPELPGCASAGDIDDEAIANAKEALELWFEERSVREVSWQTPRAMRAAIRTLVSCTIFTRQDRTHPGR
jgi:predicted RNase H-like HicB family nuclease